MWQKFTERARKVVFFAQEEAGRVGVNIVSTEHLLLGLIRENDNVATRLLDRLGISLGTIRTEVERQLTPGKGRTGQDMQLSPTAKKVIDLGYDEGRTLDNNYIGTEHILLGLVREDAGVAGRVLRELGVNLDVLRAEVKKLQEGGTRDEKSTAPLTPITRLDNSQAVIIALLLAEVEARKANESRIGTQHVLLGLLSQPDEYAYKILSRLGVSIDSVREAIDELK